MELWTAFVFGLGGSLHCVGMCGPIVMALPGASNSRLSYLWGRLLYNFGRAVTYALMGAALGAFGQTLRVAGYQQGLSIGLGVLMLLVILLPSGWVSRKIKWQPYHKVRDSIKLLWARFFTKGTRRSLFVIGILNGFLPCGFVYLALAGAITTGSTLHGAAYMALFGLGTLPILLGVSLAGKLVGTRTRTALAKLYPVAGVVVALLIVLRGMSLGIPFVSPKMKQHANQGTTVESCCSPGEHKMIIDSTEVSGD